MNYTQPSCPLCNGAVKSDGVSVWCGAEFCEWQQKSIDFVKSLTEVKTLSSISTDLGGALVPPPDFPFARQRRKLLTPRLRNSRTKGNPFGTDTSDVARGRFAFDIVSGGQVRILGTDGNSFRIGTADMGRPLGIRSADQLRECDQWGRAIGPLKS